MKKRHSAHVTEKAPSVSAPAPAPRVASETPVPSVARGGFWQGWARFWFNPVDPVGLHVVRLLSGLLFLVWLLPLAGHIDGLYGLQGWFDREAYTAAAALPEGPAVPIGWSVLYLAGDSSAVLHAIYWSSIGVLVLFALGVFPRVTAVLTWVVVASFTASPAAYYDAEALLVILAFYLMLGYLLLGLRDARLSLLQRLLGPRSAFLVGRPPEDEGGRRESVAANVALRLVQVHFALVIVVSAFAKLQTGDWWSGAALWYHFYPPLHTTLDQVRAYASSATATMFAFSLATYAVLAWQFAFPLFAWRTGVWRVLLLGGFALGWAYTALVQGLPLFGPAFFIGALSYVTASEWRRWLAWLPRVPGLRSLGRWLPPAHVPGRTQMRMEAAAAAGRSR